MNQETRNNEQQVARRGQSRDVTTREQPQRTLLPAADIYEQAEAVHVIADMPGVDKDALSIEVDGSTLTVGGDIRFDMPEGLSAAYAELRGSRYHRRFTLGNEIDTEGISAEMHNGELTVVLPKKASHRPRQIKVKVA